MSASVEKLKAARELISRPGGWTQGAYARDISGLPCKAEAPGAVCYCLSGALRAQGVFPSDNKIYKNSKTYKTLKRALPSEVSLPRYNDTPGRTQEEVVAVFDRAIALAEAESSP